MVVGPDLSLHGHVIDRSTPAEYYVVPVAPGGIVSDVTNEEVLDASHLAVPKIETPDEPLSVGSISSAVAIVEATRSTCKTRRGSSWRPCRTSSP